MERGKYFYITTIEIPPGEGSSKQEGERQKYYDDDPRFITMLRKRNSTRSLIVLFLILGIELFPIIWVVLTSFKSTPDIIGWPPKFLFVPILRNYKEIFHLGLLSGLKNSLILGSIVIFLTFILGSPFAYLVAKYSFKHKDDIKFWLLTLRIMPPIAVIIPFIYLWAKVQLIDTFFALTITYLTFSLPLYIWLSIECFKTVPLEVEEAGSLEGYSSFQVFSKISMPIALPGLISVLVFTFVFVWNEFFFAFALTSTLQTLPLVVASHGQAVYTAPWGTLSAFVSILLIPPLALVYFFSKFFAQYFLITE